MLKQLRGTIYEEIMKIGCASVFDEIEMFSEYGIMEEVELDEGLLQFYKGDEDNLVFEFELMSTRIHGKFYLMIVLDEEQNVLFLILNENFEELEEYTIGEKEFYKFLN